MSKAAPQRSDLNPADDFIRETDDVAGKAGEEITAFTSRSDIGFIEKTADTAAQVERAVESAVSQAERDRSWIARWVVFGYGVALVAYFAALAIQGITEGGWANIAREAFDCIKSAILPIVTLILGFYFGRGGKD